MFDAKCYTVMIISTGNMKEEREIVRNAVYHWNEINSESTKIIFKVSGYDIDVRADSGARPQSLINKQIVGKSDFAIAVFWNRLGTETGCFQSGSVEEIELHLKENKKVLIYFSKIKVDIDDVDPEQLQKMKEYKKTLGAKVNYKEFDTHEKLNAIINDDLTKLVYEFDRKDVAPYSSVPPLPANASSSQGTDVNQLIQDVFIHGGVPEVKFAYERQIPLFRTKIDSATKEIVINDIWEKLKSASGDFYKIIEPMKLLDEYFDFIQENQLEILGLVLDEFVNILKSGYYSYGAESYTKEVFHKITKEHYKRIRKIYITKMLGLSQYIYEPNSMVEKFLDFTSVEADNDENEIRIRKLILKQRELWSARPLDEEKSKLFDENYKILVEMKKAE